jgi:hypothetical protein
MSGNQSQPLGQITDVAANTAWPNEVTFSAWLAANLGRLSDVLDVGDLVLVGTELAVGDFRCDMVAQEIGSGRNMVIENQFGKTDHDHLGKLLTYAAKHSADIVVWISPEVRDEHRAAIDWLNKITLEGIGFFAVQLRVIAIDGSRPAPLLEVRASPNVWIKPDASGAATVSPRRELYRQFFQTLIDELRNQHFTNAKAGQPVSWYSFTSGTRGINYTVEFSTGNRLRAGLYIDIQQQAPNKAAFDFFHATKSELETAIGSPIEWERLDQKRACRISVARLDSGIDQVAPDPTEARKWVIDRLLAFKTVFGPIIPSAALAAENSLVPTEPQPDSLDA